MSLQEEIGMKAEGLDMPIPICQNCGMPSTKEEETIGITLLFSKVSRQVLCVESGKDFVDMLVGFLTLPMGCIIKLLSQAALIHKPEMYCPAPALPLAMSPLPYTPSSKKVNRGKCNEHFAMTSISNVFDSVVRLEDSRMVTDKKCLLDPKPTNGFVGKLLSSINPTPEVSTSGSVSQHNYYGCGQQCSFVTAVPGTKCPKHKSKKMETLFKIVEDIENLEAEEALGGRHCAAPVCIPPSPPSRRSTRVKSVNPDVRPQTPRGLSLDAGLALATTNAALSPIASRLSVTDELLRGYVKGGIQFMITNTLDIFASSAIKALIALNMIRTEKVGDLDTIDVLVNAEEMLQLLKASISSTNVLNDVFGKYCADVQCAPITKKNTVFFPQCADPPCHQCSRMGPPIYPAHSDSSDSCSN
ncbi:hypothetical protein BDL97_06G097400 [Sphagnum fallax]|nr:hypothetical protein BDL97_06G097400 [Sphagnum fallax]KAH8959819.1 hypothetical protein BDL97_06G097400 [Sphagnum fallax]